MLRLAFWTMAVAVIGRAVGQFCQTNQWYCLADLMKDHPEMSATMTGVLVKSCLCIGFDVMGATVGAARSQCIQFGGYLTKFFNADEQNMVVDYILGANPQAAMLFPIWAGLERNTSLSPVYHWNDGCSYPAVSYDASFASNSIPSSSSFNSYAIQADKKFVSIADTGTLRAYICRKDADSCQANPCQNQGTCTSTAKSCFNCSCPCGFTGQTCEIPQPNNDCGQLTTTTISTSTTQTPSTSTTQTPSPTTTSDVRTTGTTVRTTQETSSTTTPVATTTSTKRSTTQTTEQTTTTTNLKRTSLLLTTSKQESTTQNVQLAYDCKGDDWYCPNSSNVAGSCFCVHHEPQPFDYETARQYCIQASGYPAMFYSTEQPTELLNYFTGLSLLNYATWSGYRRQNGTTNWESDRGFCSIPYSLTSDIPGYDVGIVTNGNFGFLKKDDTAPSVVCRRDADPCSLQLCENGATCLNNRPSANCFECFCPCGFTGVTCKDPDAASSCSQSVSGSTAIAPSSETSITSTSSTNPPLTSESKRTSGSATTTSSSAMPSSPRTSTVTGTQNITTAETESNTPIGVYTIIQTVTPVVSPTDPPKETLTESSTVPLTEAQTNAQTSPSVTSSVAQTTQQIGSQRVTETEPPTVSPTLQPQVSPDVLSTEASSVVQTTVSKTTSTASPTPLPNISSGPSIVTSVVQSTVPQTAIQSMTQTVSPSVPTWAVPLTPTIDLSTVSPTGVQATTWLNSSAVSQTSPTVPPALPTKLQPTVSPAAPPTGLPDLLTIISTIIQENDLSTVPPTGSHTEPPVIASAVFSPISQTVISTVLSTNSQTETRAWSQPGSQTGLQTEAPPVPPTEFPTVPVHFLSTVLSSVPESISTTGLQTKSSVVLPTSFPTVPVSFLSTVHPVEFQTGLQTESPVVLPSTFPTMPLSVPSTTSPTDSRTGSSTGSQTVIPTIVPISSQSSSLTVTDQLVRSTKALASSPSLYPVTETRSDTPQTPSESRVTTQRSVANTKQTSTRAQSSTLNDQTKRASPNLDDNTIDYDWTTAGGSNGQANLVYHYRSSDAPSWPPLTDLIRAAQFNGYGIPTWSWFLIGCGSFVGLCLVMCCCYMCCCSDSSQKKQQF